MSTQIARVKPGDLIKAEYWNSIVDELEALDARLANLEESAPGGGPPLIKSLDPSGPLTMGDTLRIIGNNLGTSTLVSVTIANDPVTNFLSGSGDSILIIKIPPILGIPDAGKDVDLVVTNTRGSDSARFKLLPGETTVLSATLTVTNTAVPQKEIKADGSSYDYTFTISAVSSMDEVYDLNPTVDKSGWEVTVIKDGAEITELQIQKSQPSPSTRDVIVRVTIPTGATGTGNLRLGLASQKFPTVTGTSSVVPIAIGSTPGPVSTAITFATPSVIPGANFVNGEVLVSTTAKVTYRITATLADPGDYVINSPQILNDSGGLWTAVAKNDPMTFTTSQKDDTKIVIVDLTAKALAPTTSLVIKVTKAGTTVSGEFTQVIKLKT
jgi:hypothetical protein